MDIFLPVNILINLFDTFIILRLMGVFFPKENRHKKTSMVIYSLRFVLLCLLYVVSPPPIISLVISFAGLFAVTFGYKSSFPKKILAAFCAYITMFSSELLIAALVKINNFSPFISSQRTNLFYMISSELVAILLVTILIRFRNIHEDHHKMSFLLPSGLVTVITLFLEIQLFNSDNINDLTYVLSLVCIMMLNFMIYYIYDSLSASFKNKMQNELINRESKYYHEQAEMLYRNSQELKKFRHDTKNRMIAAVQMLSDNHISQAKEYLSDLTDMLSEIRLYSETGNIALDSIINYKLSTASENGIEVLSDIVLPEYIGVDEDDIIVIMGNIIDNAFEAAKEFSDITDKKSFISLKIRAEQGTVIISLKNSLSSQQSKKLTRDSNNSFLTTKNNSDSHGLGLKSVNSIVDKYNGEMKNENDNEVFETTILLFTKP